MRQHIKRGFIKNQVLLHCLDKAILYDNDMSIGNRIRAARENRGWSQKRLASAVGVTPQAVNQWEGDKTKPYIDNLRKVATATHRDISWLTGERENPLPEPAIEHPAEEMIIEDARIAPLISRVSGGNWSETFSVDELPTDTVFLDILWKPIGKAFALQITGESMESEFSSGDIIIVDTGVAPLPGDYVVAKLEDENDTTFKKYRPRGPDSDGAPIIELVPLNSDWPTLTISAQRPGRIIATMIESRRFRRRK